MSLTKDKNFKKIAKLAFEDKVRNILLRQFQVMSWNSKGLEMRRSGFYGNWLNRILTDT